MAVNYSLNDRVGIILIDSPPVNAIGDTVRRGLLTCLNQGLNDDRAEALMITCTGKTFCAGSDIKEFGKQRKQPLLRHVINEIENSRKPIVVVVHGTAFGGGFELALGCHYRIATRDAKVGLPEVKLGLLPGAGGTQRLPRLTGPRKALEIITTGDPVSASDALESGIIDELCEPGGGYQAGLNYARRLIETKSPTKRVCDIYLNSDGKELTATFNTFRKEIQGSTPHLFSPLKCVDAIEAAYQKPFLEGLQYEQKLFDACLDSPQCKGLIHAFFAERKAGKLLSHAESPTIAKVQTVGVIGAGTMGTGIAMTFANAGIPVVLTETTPESLDRGMDAIRRTYERSVQKGRLTQCQMDDRMAMVLPTLSYRDLGQLDLVVEAAYEDMGIKKAIFSELDKTCKPGTILASNTSTLSIDVIASATNRPSDVIGLHFFSPAHIMKLLEVVAGTKTSPQVIKTTMELGRKIGKVPVLVGNCYGFVGNRMLHRRNAEAINLVSEGASPQQVDRVLTDFGFPMGPFTMSDLAGLDVGYRIRQERRKGGEDIAPSWLDQVVELGRHGQKNGAGVYQYKDGKRTPLIDPKIDELLKRFRAESGIQPRSVLDKEIIERCLYIMINEGARILEEGIAICSSDIDVIWLYGYGFPRHLGGPMFWADQIGLNMLCHHIERIQKSVGGAQWVPSLLLRTLAAENGCFKDLPDNLGD